MLLDSNNFKFLDSFMLSDLFENLIFFDEQEKLKSFFGNLYFFIFQMLSKPNAKFYYLELLFSKEKIINYFNFMINDSSSSVHRMNLIMNFDLLLKEITQNLDSDKLEDSAYDCPKLFDFLNNLNEKIFAN